MINKYKIIYKKGGSNSDNLDQLINKFNDSFIFDESILTDIKNNLEKINKKIIDKTFLKKIDNLNSTNLEKLNNLFKFFFNKFIINNFYEDDNYSNKFIIDIHYKFKSLINEKENLENLEYLKNEKLLNLILYPINNNNNILLDNKLIFKQIISDKLNYNNWSANDENFDYIFTDYDKEFRNNIFNNIFEKNKNFFDENAHKLLIYTIKFDQIDNFDYLFKKMNPCHLKKNNQENENIFDILNQENILDHFNDKLKDFNKQNVVIKCIEYKFDQIKNLSDNQEKIEKLKKLLNEEFNKEISPNDLNFIPLPEDKNKLELERQIEKELKELEKLEKLEKPVLNVNLINVEEVNPKLQKKKAEDLQKLSSMLESKKKEAIAKKLAEESEKEKAKKLAEEAKKKEASEVIKNFVISKFKKKNTSALTPSYVPIELSQVANETLIEFNDLKNNKLSIKLINFLISQNIITQPLLTGTIFFGKRNKENEFLEILFGYANYKNISSNNNSFYFVKSI